MMSLAERLAERAMDAATKPDLSRLRPLTLTNFAATIGATDGSERPLMQVISGDEPASKASRLAARMHVRTQDDFFPAGRVHVGAIVTPAVLAVGGDRFWNAVAAGYEVFTTLAATYASDCQRRGFRPSGILGPPAAAAAAGVALGLPSHQLASAIAAGATASAGTNQSWIDGSGEWLLEVATAVRAGVEAALLVRAGFVSAVGQAFEGPFGWATAYFGDAGGARLEGQLNAVDDCRRVATKPYPVSGIAQVPTHLSALLGSEMGRRLPERMVVMMPSDSLDYPGSRNRGPFRSRSDSLMSVARCCALGYLSGFVSLASLSQPPEGDELRLLELIELLGDERSELDGVTVTVQSGGCTMKKEGRADDLLYPTWDELSSDLAGLANRSEASETEVLALAEALDADVVDPIFLLRRLEAIA